MFHWLVDTACWKYIIFIMHLIVIYYSYKYKIFVEFCVRYYFIWQNNPGKRNVHKYCQSLYMFIFNSYARSCLYPPQNLLTVLSDILQDKYSLEWSRLSQNGLGTGELIYKMEKYLNTLLSALEFTSKGSIRPYNVITDNIGMTF